MDKIYATRPSPYPRPRSPQEHMMELAYNHHDISANLKKNWYPALVFDTAHQIKTKTNHRMI